MTQPCKVAGVILAGGRATRMNHQDKGLILYHNRSLISYAIAALTPVVDTVFINANRNIDNYQHFGLPVISDHTMNYEGPLAGVLAAMQHTTADNLLVIACDCPLIEAKHTKKLVLQHLAAQHQITVAFDGSKRHPIFFVVQTSLQHNLSDFLTSGQRKVGLWLAQHAFNQVDFSDEPTLFTNVNTLNELIQLQTHTHAILELPHAP